MERLIADIGGTHARFALAGSDGRPYDEQKLLVADFPGPVEAARAYLAGRKIRDAVLAVATAVDSDWIALTNAPWAFSVAATREALGLNRLAVINDFTAQALAVPRLASEECTQIKAGQPRRGSAIAVIGPGTGLGVGGLLPIQDTWYPIPSEGGHVSLATHDEREAALLARLRRRFGHVSNERVLSGPGLINLATALAELDGERDRFGELQVRCRAAPRVASALIAGKLWNASRRYSVPPPETSRFCSVRWEASISAGVCASGWGRCSTSHGSARASSRKGGSRITSSASRSTW